jgi:hypothetical protein
MKGIVAVKQVEKLLTIRMIIFLHSYEIVESYDEGVTISDNTSPDSVPAGLIKSESSMSIQNEDFSNATENSCSTSANIKKDNSLKPNDKSIKCEKHKELYSKRLIKFHDFFINIFRIKVPAVLIGFFAGKDKANKKALEEKTGCKIELPYQDSNKLEAVLSFCLVAFQII